MPQREITPQRWSRVPSLSPKGVRLEARDKTKAQYRFEVIDDGIFRTTFSASTHPLPPIPTTHPDFLASQSHGSDVKLSDTEGGKRSIGGRIGNTTYHLSWDSTPVLTLTSHDPATVTKTKTTPPPIYADLPGRSFILDGPSSTHYTLLSPTPNSFHLGLGEKAAPLSLAHRRFTMSSTDSFGYDVHRTDPLYKNVPFLITCTPATPTSPSACVAIFNTSHGRGIWDVGCEMDGKWGRYKYYRHDYGGLDEYLLLAPDLQGVCERYAKLTGYPNLVRRWALGYLAGGMKYSMSDSPPAHELCGRFAQQCKQHDIPCSGFQLSSGYTVTGPGAGRRNVFTWNKHRFPDPEAWVRRMRREGVRVLANVKPYLMEGHPDYGGLKEGGGLFRDRGAEEESGDENREKGPWPPAMTMLWSLGGGESARGSHIDMSSKAGLEYWKKGVKELAEIGIEGIWNDNNEYSITNDDWECAWDEDVLENIFPAATASVKKEENKPSTGQPVGLTGRNLHTTLMSAATRSSLLALNPTTRPFILTRSACPSTHRFSTGTWSGDNVTSWDSLRGSLALSQSASLAQLGTHYGHDVGGFEGPQPSPQLLLRWVWIAVHSTRFAVNCFKTSETDRRVGEVIELWMYPEILPEVRQAVKRRYAMLPYIYSLVLEGHLYAKPPIRWVGYGCEGDQEVWKSEELTGGEGQFWFGDALMVVGVFGEDVEEARAYLPKLKNTTTDFGYLNLAAKDGQKKYYDSGQWVTVEAPWKGCVPILARVGAFVPVGRSKQTLAPGETENPADLPADDWRGVEIFPPRVGDERAKGYVFKSQWYEDDGISLDPEIVSWTLEYSVQLRSHNDIEQHEVIEVDLNMSTVRSGKAPYRCPWNGQIHIVMPEGDLREVVTKSGREDVIF